MNTHFIFNRFISRAYTRIITAAIIWFLGIMIGICLATVCPLDFVGMLRSALFLRPPLISLLLSTSVPIVVLYFLLKSRLIRPCYLFFLLESICRGLIGMLCFIALGSGSWLIRLFLLFSHSLVSVLLWWFFLKNIDYRNIHITRDFYILIITNIEICLLDCFLISKYLCGLPFYF